MLDLITDNTMLIIGLAIALAAILLVANMALGWQLDLRVARMPLATASETLSFEIARKKAERDELSTKLQDLRRMVDEHGRYAAEVAALKELLESLRLEAATLDAQRAEIEAVKQEAADVAEKYARAQDQLRELEAMDERRRQLEARCTALQQKVEALDAEHDRKRSELETSLSALRDEAETLEASVADLSEQLRDLDAKRRDRDALATEVLTLAHRVGEMRHAIAGMAADEAKARALSEEIAAQRAEESRIRTAIEALAGAERRLQARIAQLEAERERLAQQTGGPAVGDGDGAELLADLRRTPDCLAFPRIVAGVPMPEEEALANLDKRLKERGLDYPESTQRAFHTALKINDHAQMTVLAGVSGTGKSLLPRSYGEALGIHFLPIAVEPRWDSPQDLLGFYNYVEKRYRATDLARALARLDPYDTAEIGAEFKDRMLIVLLDEMNLARVEYYFSEFLSRLEARPRHAADLSPVARRFAEIQIDIRGLDKDKLPAVFPGHNVLFTGTMNDDESTQALSDKVMDRANILQFPAPQKFVVAGSAASSAGWVNDEALPFATWRSWTKPVSALQGTDLQTAKEILSKLAGIMQSCGRPFGHRLYEAILAYAANYPRHDPRHPKPIETPLADQIETRILPKLRGIEIDERRETLERLVTLVRDDLRDGKLADAISQALEVDGGRGLFAWRGLVR